MRAVSRDLKREDTADGFTLVEMLVVLAIMAVVAAIAAPGVVRNHRSKDLSASAAEIVTKLNRSRTLTIATAMPRRVVIDPHARAIRFDDQDTLILSDDVKMSVTIGQETLLSNKEAILTFLPDGSASGADIELQRKAQIERIEVNWLTGLSSRHRLP